MNAALTATQTQRVTLYYREGSSDKVYQASIEPKGELFLVNFAFGRRGSTLQTGTKTSSPVDYQTAKNTLDRLVREKMAKGYTPGPEGTPYQHTEAEERATGILPQLLNPIDESQVNRFLNDPAWCAQEKFDGRRMLLRKQGDQVTAINRKGLAIGLLSSIGASAQKIPGDFLLDGECVGERFYVFDALQIANLDLRREPYQKRLVALLNLLGLAMQRDLVMAYTTFAVAQKRDLFNWLKRENKEGIVFKRLNAPYSPGRPASGGPAFKFKFHATVSAVVSKVNPQRSVELRLLNCQGWVPIGNVTIPSNQPVPEVGWVVNGTSRQNPRPHHYPWAPIYAAANAMLVPASENLTTLRFLRKRSGRD